MGAQGKIILKKSPFTGRTHIEAVYETLCPKNFTPIGSVGMKKGRARMTLPFFLKAIGLIRQKCFIKKHGHLRSCYLIYRPI